MPKAAPAAALTDTAHPWDAECPGRRASCGFGPRKHPDALRRSPDLLQGVDQIGHAADVGRGFQHLGLQGPGERIAGAFLRWYGNAGLGCHRTTAALNSRKAA